MSERYVATVITDLQMRAVPGRLPPQPSGFSLALMGVEDCPLHFYRYLYATIGREHVWVDRLAMSDEELSGVIHREGVEISVLYGNGAPAGFFELDFSNREKVDLAYFGLMPEWIGKRLGAWLLGVAVSEGFSRGAEVMTVNTCTMDHPSALTLYQRMGFSPVGRREHRLILPDGYELPGHIEAAVLP
ncbi:GNAT family N-acetyltransferase [Afifella sp. IM 167]|uniref:GNAT family N-acetyltransferase n=1 Tax=Afifella sp. IM 167 TaxID=2033586 RepID=UPI001CCCFDCD|nr:GNAT family N-acetyltransferase [Afifella sp. IM 167]MBZ8132452.1 GNAT family N-acetyltransferase [Afifella sp. IM 167]